VSGERFSVVVFNPDGFWHYALTDVGPKEAVEEAKRLVDKAKKYRRYHRVMIENVSDETAAFLWERGKGIVYPPREEAEP
jgi:hypothetical protein